MDYYTVEETLQVLFENAIPLSKSQNRHLREICMGVLLAGSTQLSRIARWLKHQTQQDSRVQWLRRSLEAEYLAQEYVYYPFVQRVLAQHKTKQVHLVMDRTPLPDKSTDLLSLSLNFRHRAIPIGWQFLAHGSSTFELQTALIDRCRPLLPVNIPIVFHGDNEFGGVKLMQYIQHLRWDFVLGQSRKNHFRSSSLDNWQPLGTLPVTKRQAVYLEHIELTKKYGYGPLNLFAFYQPRFSNRKRKRDITYCATSLPITPLYGV
jgi:hypothetical protein